MGPSLIFDKSLLQSLNPDEAMWLDNFYTCNMTTLFFIETLADLEKEVGNGRTPEEVVGSIAHKTPDRSSVLNVNYKSLIAGELIGLGEVDMKYRRPILSGGSSWELDGEVGITFEKSPEEKAFERWQEYKFLEIEKLQAKKWREDLSNINLEDNYLLFQKFLTSGKPKTLEEVKKLVDSIIDSTDKENNLIFGMWLLGIPQHSQQRVLERWKKMGEPPLKKFALYFCHVFSVDLFFNIAIAADLIGHGRASHKIDLAYLYYLPFCHIFTSNDKLHAQIIQHFLELDQTFIPGGELKVDLKKLDEHYDKLPPEIKKRGVMSYAFYPPADDQFLVAKMWDKYMARDWRTRKPSPVPQPKSEINDELLKKLKRMQTESKSVGNNIPVNSDEAHHMVVKRSVRARKGKWDIFPPEVLNRRKNANGDWEDIPLSDE